MIEAAVAREIACLAPPHSRHFEAPRWWPEWIAQVLAAERPRSRPRLEAHPAADEAAAFLNAAGTLRSALREAQEAAALADDAVLTVARHQVYLARRALRAVLDAVAADGPGNRLEWCSCGEDPPAA